MCVLQYVAVDKHIVKRAWRESDKAAFKERATNMHIFFIAEVKERLAYNVLWPSTFTY